MSAARVLGFLEWLRAEHPDTILVSGGAPGVDKTAETAWSAHGGSLESYRPRQLGPESYGIEFWELGGEQPRVFLLEQHPTWANYASACIYRDLLIAEACDRLVAFYRAGRSRGTAITAGFARDLGKQVYEDEGGKDGADAL